MTTAKQLTNVAAIATIFALGLQLPASAATADQCTALELGGEPLSDVLAVAYSSDGSQIFVADYGNQRALVLDAASGNIINEFEGVITDGHFPATDVLEMSRPTARKVQRVPFSPQDPSWVGSGADGCKDGTFNEAEFKSPSGLSSNPGATITAVADRNCHSVRFIDWTTQTVTSIGLNSKFSDRTTAVNGAGSDARFDNPSDVDWSPDGTMLVVSDDYNHALRLVTYPEKVVSTLAGAGFFAGGKGTSDDVGTAARFDHPRSVSFSPDSKYVIVADMGNNQVRKIEVATAAVSTITGLDGVFGSSSPWGIDWHPTDPTKVIVADRGNNKIQILTCAELVPAPEPTSEPTPGPTSEPTPGPTPGPTYNPTPGPTTNPTPGPTSQLDGLVDAIRGLSAMVKENSDELSEIKGLLNRTGQAPSCYGRRTEA